jgi:hypothetical protein
MFPAASTAISARNRSNNAGVTLPPSLGTNLSSAPSARIVRSFSSAKASDDNRTSLYPFAAQTIASDEPVLPPVYSTTRMPGDSEPRRSAPSIIASAMRSL